MEELSYAKRYQNVFDQDISEFVSFFDQDISEFVSCEILERSIEEEFLNKIASLNPNDKYYEARKHSFQSKK